MASLSTQRLQSTATKALLATTLLSSSFAMLPSAQANIVITGTRAVYEEGKTLSIQMKNSSESPSVVQSWIDAGEEDIDKGRKTKVPFVITPPLVRVEGNKGQSLVIRYTGKESDLPRDRESVFYLNVLDIPPKPKAEDLGGATNFIQFAVRSRIKLFYRPKNLPMVVSDSYEKVTWHALGDDKVKISNPTPYHITYQIATVGNLSSRSIEMLSPFSDLEVIIPEVKKGDKVTWSIINDFGGESSGESIIQ